MAKSANLYARIEPAVKEEAESILEALGVSASNAINMFYKQIILQRGIPFEMRLPAGYMLNLGSASQEQLNLELEKGYADVQAGRIRPAYDVFADIHKDCGI